MAEYIECRECDSPHCKGCNLKNLETMLRNGKFDCIMNENRCINTVADVVPVVHGRWEWFDEETGTPFTGYEREWGWKCSYCGEELPDDYDDPDNRPTFRFCHSCGAKMDGGVDDAAD